VKHEKTIKKYSLFFGKKRFFCRIIVEPRGTASFAEVRMRENVMKILATAAAAAVGAMTVPRADPKPRVILSFRFLP